MMFSWAAAASCSTSPQRIAGVREVEIPVSDPKMREPLDLGLIEVSLRSPSRSNQ